MTIKVIDLLNKIANGEEVPKRIKHYQAYYTWYDNGYNKGYCKEPVMTDGNSYLEINTEHDLLGKVEIIEEEPEIDIQGIKEHETGYTERCIDIEVREKLNELIKAIKQLDKQIKEEK